MDFIKVLEKRKSTRKFTGEIIDKNIVNDAIKTAQKAPSAGGLRAYKFVSITTKDTIKKISETAGQSWIERAGAIVVICVDPEKSAKRYGNRGRSLYSFQDATLFGSHMDLYFVNRGLGTCWVGAFNESKLTKLLKLSHRPISLLVIGNK